MCTIEEAPFRIADLFALPYSHFDGEMTAKLPLPSKLS
jgi:hypothetical protein